MQNESAEQQGNYNLGYIWLISIVAAMGGLLFGWDWVVIGGAKPFFQRYFQLTSEAQIGWANSCALLGCLVGALIAGALSDRFGRKRLLVVAALQFAVTSLGNALANNFTVFVAWRMLGGVAIGLASNLSPMYIAEVAPARMRGRLVSINQLTIVIGILLAQYINWFLVRHLPAGASDEYIRDSWFGQQGWRWMFGLTAAPALLFLLGMFLVPESPRWLAKYGQAERARRVAARRAGPGWVRPRGSGLHGDEADVGAGRGEHVGHALLVGFVADEQHNDVLERARLGVLERRNHQVGGLGRIRTGKHQHVARQHAASHGVLHVRQLAATTGHRLLGIAARHQVRVGAVGLHALHVVLHDLAKVGVPSLGVVRVGRLGRLLAGLLAGLFGGFVLAAGAQSQAGGQCEGSEEGELTHGGHLLFRVAC